MAARHVQGALAELKQAAGGNGQSLQAVEVVLGIWEREGAERFLRMVFEDTDNANA